MAEDHIFSDGRTDLAEELKADLVDRGLDPNKVVLTRSLTQLINSYVRPALREVLEGDSAEALIQLALDPHETIAMSIQEEYRGQEWDNADLGLPWEFENLELSVVEDVSDLERLDVREVSPGRFLLRIQATVECEFDAFVHKADAIWLEDLIVHEFNWNDHYLWGGVSRQLRCELDLAVDFSDGTEPELSVLSMQPISR